MKEQGGEAALPKGDPVGDLATKTIEFLVEQDEWRELAELPRPQRRAAMKELAQRLYTLPIMDGINTVPRQVRRKAAKQLGNVARDLARKEVLQAVAMREEQILRDAAAVGYAQREAELQQAVADELVSPEAAAKAAADRVLAEGGTIETAKLEAIEAASVAELDKAAMLEGDVPVVAGEANTALAEDDDPALD
jgi:hypothetical protein